MIIAMKIKIISRDENIIKDIDVTLLLSEDKILPIGSSLKSCKAGFKI